MNNNFKVVDENGIERNAEAIIPFTYENKDYLVYSIDRDLENANIFVSSLEKDSEGYDTIKDIEDEEERGKVKAIVKRLLEEKESDL